MTNCLNCDNEVPDDTTDVDTGFCIICQKAYDLGYTDGHYDGVWRNE